MRKIDSNKFIRLYNDAVLCYEKYKKDFITVNLMHLKYVKENTDLDKKLIRAKLKKLVNLYTNQVNINFSKRVYSQCSYAWSNASLFIERNLWLCIQAIESDDDKKNSYKEARRYYENIENTLKKLSLEKIKIYNKPISEVLTKTNLQIEHLQREKYNV